MDNPTRKYIPKSVRLMDQVREVLRFHHYAYNTEKSYVTWILQYIRFNDRRHPKDMGKAEVESFLSYLALNRRVSASTQNMLEDGVNIRMVQTLLGHKDVKTTEIYTHVMSTQFDAVNSPLDNLP